MAVVDCRVVAHGPDAKAVLDEARARAPGSEPLIHLVSSVTWIL